MYNKHQATHSGRRIQMETVSASELVSGRDSYSAAEETGELGVKGQQRREDLPTMPRTKAWLGNRF